MNDEVRLETSLEKAWETSLQFFFCETSQQRVIWKEHCSHVQERVIVQALLVVSKILIYDHL